MATNERFPYSEDDPYFAPKPPPVYKPTVVDYQYAPGGVPPEPGRGRGREKPPVQPPIGGLTLQDYGQWLVSRSSDEINAIFGKAPTYNEWVTYMEGGAPVAPVPPFTTLATPPIAPIAPIAPMTAATMPPAGTPEWAAWIEETTGQPQAGYMAGLGLYGQAYQTPYQQYQAGRYDPMNFLWQMQAPMEMAGFGGYNPTQYLSQFGPQQVQDPFAMYAMAGRTLGDVMGMTPEQRAGVPGAEYGGGLAQLLGLGLREQLGPGAKWLQGRIPAERTQWQAQYPMQQGPSFLDYIREKYNLGQYF